MRTLILLAFLVTPLTAQTTTTYVGANSRVLWDHDGTDPGGSGLDRFEIEFLDVAGVVVDSASVAPDVRELSLATIPETTRGLRVRAVDAAGNASTWTNLSGLHVDHEAPPVVITITITVGTP